jgi:hypothetical protein
MVVTAALAACAAVPQITRLQAQSAPAGTPYENILVVSLFDSFDSRKYYEKETVKALEALGTKAVALTSQVDLREPVNRETILPVVQKLGVDAVLVTQLSNLRTTAETQNRRPESTRNIRPTYYYNVFSVELTEYSEPPALQYNFDLSLRADLFSVESKESVWAVASKTKDKSELDGDRDYSKYVDQATAIVRALKQDRLIGK